QAFPAGCVAASTLSSRQRRARERPQVRDARRLPSVRKGCETLTFTDNSIKSAVVFSLYLEYSHISLTSTGISLWLHHPLTVGPLNKGNTRFNSHSNRCFLSQHSLKGPVDLRALFLSGEVALRVIGRLQRRLF